MPDNDFWIGQEQIPVDLSLLLTYHNDEDYWYAPGEYALRVYTVDTLNTNFARPCFALGERKFDPEMEDVSGAIENTLHELLDSGATPEDVYRIMGLVKESELSSDARTLCHDGLNDLFCGLPCGIHKAASRAVTEIFCHVHFSFLAENA